MTKILQFRENMNFIILSVLMIFSAFVGVYYPEEFLVLHIITALCLLICLFTCTEKKIILLNLMDYSLLALTLLYIISTVWAANPQLAFEESLKYVNYFLLYLFAAKIITGRQINSIIKMFVLVGSVLAFIGILNYLELVSMPGVVQGGRITVTLKYPNALGSFLLACIVLAHHGIGEWKPTWLYNLGIYLMIVAFIGTFSRASYLVAVPIIIVLYLIFQKEKKQVITASLLLFLVGTSASLVIYSGAAVFLKLAAFVLGIAAVSISGRKKVVLACALSLAAVVLLLIPQQNTGQDNSVVITAVAESKIVDRLQNINLEDSSLQVRLVMYQDAVQLIKENVLVGQGGGAWRTLYTSVRTFLYYSLDPHSYPLKIATETGLLGAALFLAVIWCVFKNIIQPVQERKRVVALALSAILLHSFVDFDLTIGILALTTWILLGIMQIDSAVLGYKSVPIRKWLLIAFCGIFLLVSSALLTSVYLADMKKEVTYEEANGRLLQAVSIYPLNSKNYGTLAATNYQAFKITGEEKYLDAALDQIEKAIKLNPLNYNWYLDKTFYLTEKGAWDQAVAVINSKQDSIPKFQNDSYTKTAYYLRMCAIGYLNNNETEKSRQVLAGTLRLWEKAQEQISTVSAEYYSLWREEILTVHDPFLLEVINAYDYMGEKDKARELITKLTPQTIAENEWLRDI